jgi:Glutaredoxin-like domain (DUF836)
VEQSENYIRRKRILNDSVPIYVAAASSEPRRSATFGMRLFHRTIQPVTYELVTRSGCHLCDEMAVLLDEVLPSFGLTWSPRDVDAEPELRARYTDVVPVLLRDGQPVAKLRTDRRSLIRIVQGRR